MERERSITKANMEEDIEGRTIIEIIEIIKEDTTTKKKTTIAKEKEMQMIETIIVLEETTETISQEQMTTEMITEANLKKEMTEVDKDNTESQNREPAIPGRLSII